MNIQNTNIVNIVFLLDVSQSMEKSLDLIKNLLSSFHKSITNGIEYFNKDNVTITRNKLVRYKLVGYRDHLADGNKWFVEFPFVIDINEIIRQMDHPDMQSSGNGNRQNSLLDAIYILGNMPEDFSDDLPGHPDKWFCNKFLNISKIVFIISDSPFRRNATLPEIKDFDLNMIYEKIFKKKLKILGLIPGWIGYEDIFSIPNSEAVVYDSCKSVEKLDENSNEGVKEHKTSTNALIDFLKNPDCLNYFILVISRTLKYMRRIN